MICPKKILTVVVGLFIAVFSGVFSVPVLASQSQYFDWGPYYESPQVLGFSLSSLEDLPALNLPPDLNLPPAQGILADSPFYPFERFIENTQLAFTFDPVKKEQFRLEIAGERLSEAKTLMEQGKTQAASRALDDYSQSFASLTQNLAALATQGNPQTNGLIEQVEEAAAAQSMAALALNLSTPPAQAQIWSQAADSARESLDQIAELKGEPAIPEQLQTGLQKLKEQGLISEEENNKLYGLKQRSQVREELDKLISSGQIPPQEIVKLDTAVAQRFPKLHTQQLTNLQVVELRSYQTLPQPSQELIKLLEDWQKDTSSPPSNDIKPYLWYNRARDLATEVDLTNFSPTQQTDLVKFYPESLAQNSSYVPLPSPSPSPTPIADDQSTVPPAPSPSPVPATPYLQDPGGALPGTPAYILKQAGESIGFALTFDPATKTRLQIEAAERRLAEAEALSHDPQKSALYASAMSNYQKTLADASKRLSGLADSKNRQNLARKLESQAARHEVIFEKGLMPPPAQKPNFVADVLETTEDAMDISADALQRPALPPVLSGRLGDLKAQGLILPEEAEDLVNSSSRQEVRSKIRELLKLQTFPLADAKKLDEAQNYTAPADYNQLVEVRKVEELQSLRSVQADLAQTPTLKTTASNLDQKEASLEVSIDPALIKPEDLTGRDDLLKTYQGLIARPRPINGGQFGAEATPGASPAATPSPQDAVLTTCPEGAVFKQFEGCVWADSGKNINDYDQYKCDGPRQYYSFAVRKCVAYDPDKGWNAEDARPICPMGYTWSWQTQSCQVFTGGGTLPYPTPSPEPEPVDEKEIEERSKSCPEGSSYQTPGGCVWDENAKSVYDSDQYRCGRGRYYSFQEQKCINAPKEGEPYPKDAAPSCKEEGAYWSWTEGKCRQAVAPSSTQIKDITIPDPAFATPGSFFYPLKQWTENIKLVITPNPEAKQEIRIQQAKERLAEGYFALQNGKTGDFTKALKSYTTRMQELYNDLGKSSLSDNSKKAIGEKLAKEAAEQNLILQKIGAVAQEESDTVINAASQTVILGIDKAADLTGESPLPQEVKTKIEALPEQMISEEDKKKLLQANSRVEARLGLGELVSKGGLTQQDTAFLNEDFNQVDQSSLWKIEELKKLEDLASTSDQKEKVTEKAEKNEVIVEKLREFQADFEPGKEIAAEVRPYVRLTRIEEVTQTIRPDIIRLDDFQNRQDIQLAVATLQEEFKPTTQSLKQVEEFRRRNPGASLPPNLARIEALSYSLGIREQAGPCYLPSPPFASGTPCPPPGAPIQVASYYSGPNSTSWYGAGSPNTTPSLDKDGKPLIYGQGPKPASAGACPSGYHWMYDSGGWCMSDGGNYNYSSYNSTPSGPGPNYTPYSPYYTAPGAPPAGSYSYSPSSYYGPAPTYYTTTPPAGTVPGSGPRPVSPGQCPSGFHWMSDSGGWCMANGNTYVPPGTPDFPAGTATTEKGSYNCGSQPYDPVTKKCKDGACPGGFYWDDSKCVAGYYRPGAPSGSSSGGSTPWCWSAFPPPGGWTCGTGSSWDQSSCSCKSSGGTSGGNTPSSYQYGCTPGYYWDGSKCVAGSYEGSGWSDSTARSGTYCQPPSSGCGSSSYWDYGSCSCRSSSTYYSGSSGGSTSYSSSSCSPPAGGCGSGWFDSSSCSCKQASSQGCYNVSASSCPSGWYFDSAVCTCRQSTTSGTSGGSTTSSGGSCPSGYHWMSDNGGWCMSDGAASTTTSSPSPSSTTTSSPAPSTSSAPAPSSEPAPAQSSEPAPAPAQSSEPAPAPSP